MLEIVFVIVFFLILAALACNCLFRDWKHSRKIGFDNIFFYACWIIGLVILYIFCFLFFKPDGNLLEERVSRARETVQEIEVENRKIMNRNRELEEDLRDFSRTRIAKTDLQRRNREMREEEKLLRRNIRKIEAEKEEKEKEWEEEKEELEKRIEELEKELQEMQLVQETIEIAESSVLEETPIK